MNMTPIDHDLTCQYVTSNDKQQQLTHQIRPQLFDGFSTPGGQRAVTTKVKLFGLLIH